MAQLSSIWHVQLSFENAHIYAFASIVFENASFLQSELLIDACLQSVSGISSRIYPWRHLDFCEQLVLIEGLVIYLLNWESEGGSLAFKFLNLLYLLRFFGRRCLIILSLEIMLFNHLVI